MSANTKPKPAEVADAWNAAHQVGQCVRYWTGAREGDGKVSRTRTVAKVFYSQAVVWVEGEGSCIALTHVKVTTAADVAAAEAAAAEAAKRAAAITAGDLLGTVRRKPNGKVLAVLWPSPPDPARWMVTDQWGSCGYETDEKVADWPVVGAVPYSPAAGMALTPINDEAFGEARRG
jgi:hypothetical protein